MQRRGEAVVSKLEQELVGDHPFIPLTTSSRKQQPPDGWRWCQLTDLARLESGHTPSRSRPDWWGGDIPWIALPDIRALDGKVAMTTIESTNPDGIANSAARVLPAGTVVLSRTASVGFVTIMGRPMATSQDFFDWVCGPELDPLFLMFLFQASRGYFRSLASGATHKTVYFPTAEALQVCVPLLGEQRRIAALLQDQMAAAERARAAAEARLEAAQVLPAAIVRSVFLDSAARDWPQCRIADVCRVHAGQHILENDYNQEGIGIGYLTGPADFGVTSPTVSKWTGNPRAFSLPGDVLVTVKGAGVGKANLAPCEKVAIGRQLMAIRPNQDLADQFFIYIAVQTHFVRLQSRALGATVPGLTRDEIENLPIRLPSLPMQRAMLQRVKERVAAADSVRAAVQEELTLITRLPAVLLHRAFTGEL
jgi:type I restriction enzyme S subunit